jgi:hypothetical protein
MGAKLAMEGEVYWISTRTCPTPPGTMPSPAGSPLPRLTRLQFWSFLAIGLVIFVFSTGPIWRDPWRMENITWAAVYSYLPIPVLVLAGLAYKKRLGLRAFFLDTLELTLLKYALTFGIALVLWGIVPALPIAPTVPHANAATDAPEPTEPAPTPTPIAPERTGTIEGTVVDAAGHPRAGALAYVEAGLEGYVFAAPATPLVLENDGRGITPRLAAVQLRQPVFARATDGHLHTLVADKDGAVLFNVPLLSSGAQSRVRITEAHGVAGLRCIVHPRTGTEAAAHLAVFAHPFFAITGADGRFTFRGVPAGALRVGAWDEESGTRTQEARVDAGGAVRLQVTMGGRLPPPTPAASVERPR